MEGNNLFQTLLQAFDMCSVASKVSPKRQREELIVTGVLLMGDCNRVIDDLRLLLGD